MKHFIVIWFLLLQGCTFSFIDVPLNQEVDAPPWGEDAIELVKLEWADRLDIRLTGDIQVRWFEGECLRYSPDDDHYGWQPGECLAGVYERALDDVQIHISLGNPSDDLPPAHDTALAHEFLHWALDELGDTDGAHESAWWDQVDGVEEMLAAAGM